MTRNISIILPARNEADSLETLLPELRQSYPEEEIIVVDDGSKDDTVAICNKNNVTVVSHAYSMGNGAANKTAVRIAKGNIIMLRGVYDTGGILDTHGDTVLALMNYHSLVEATLMKCRIDNLSPL